MGPGRRAPTEGVRAGVEVADEVEGGGVGLFTRVPVRVRKAVRMAVEARRSGVRGTSSAGGDMRRGVARRVSAGRYGRRLGAGYRGREKGRDRGSRRVKWQWRERIESVMGALGCFWAVMSGVCGCPGACEGRCCLLVRITMVRGVVAGAVLYPTCVHLDSVARRGGGRAALDALPDDELRRATTAARKSKSMGKPSPVWVLARDSEAAWETKQQPPPKHQAVCPTPALTAPLLERLYRHHG